MRIVYTKHAVLQMEKRKLEKVWIEETIKYPDKTEREGMKKYYASKKLNGITLLLSAIAFQRQAEKHMGRCVREAANGSYKLEDINSQYLNGL